MTTVVRALAIMAGLAGCQVHDDPPSAADDPSALHFLARQPRTLPTCSSGDELIRSPAVACEVDGHGDADGDGHVDCWRLERGTEAEPISTLAVWRDCAGGGLRFAVGDTGFTILAIPRELASSAWLRWLAEHLVDPRRVTCAGAIDGCTPQDPGWDWTLASADRRDGEPGEFGTVAPQWHAGVEPDGAARAMIVPSVGTGWLQRTPDPETPPPPESLAGARIIVDAGTHPPYVQIDCAGEIISSHAGGVLAQRGDRWSWLFRAPPDRALVANTLLCVDDIVLVSDGGPFAAVAAIDPRTGGWVYVPGTDGGPGVALWDTPTGPWWQDDGVLAPFAAVRAWLALPNTTRVPKPDLAPVRPELADDNAQDVASQLSSVQSEPREIGGALIPSSAIRGRAGLTSRARCDGWNVQLSPTAALAERDGRARWIYVEQRTPRQLTGARCEGDRIVLTRVTGKDLLGLADVGATRDEIVVDLASATRWRR